MKTRNSRDWLKLMRPLNSGLSSKPPKKESSSLRKSLFRLKIILLNRSTNFKLDSQECKKKLAKALTWTEHWKKEAPRCKSSIVTCRGDWTTKKLIWSSWARSRANFWKSEKCSCGKDLRPKPQTIDKRWRFETFRTPMLSLTRNA